MKPIEKGHIGFAEGFLGPRGAYSGGDREFDWKKAKEFIDANSDKIASVTVGLAEDWTYTSGEVYENGKYIPQEDTYVYASSSWATPAMDIEYKDGNTETVECWVIGSNPESYFELSESEAV